MNRLAEPGTVPGNAASIARVLAYAAFFRATLLFVVALFCCALPSAAETSPAVARGLFDAGVNAYRAGRYEAAAEVFSETAKIAPSTGVFLNLGNAEWRSGRTGHAVRAWEQALWIDPFNKQAKNNLQLARHAAQLDPPYLAWYEVASSWLPSSWWAWLTGFSLWTTVGAALLPGILRLRKSSWYQAMSAVGLAIFLVSLPTHLGVARRAHLGFVLERDTPLRLTPTREAQFTTRLAAGEPVRFVRTRGDFVFVRAQRSQGWIDVQSFGAVVPGYLQ